MIWLAFLVKRSIQQSASTFGILDRCIETDFLDINFNRPVASEGYGTEKGAARRLGTLLSVPVTTRLNQLLLFFDRWENIYLIQHASRKRRTGC
jgi:hypothetical protein